MNKSRVRILAINSVIALAVVGVGWWGWSALHPAPAKVSAQTAIVSLGDVQSTVSASGTVISPGDVGVSPTVSGLITAINVSTGQHVTAGTTMATLQNNTQLNALNSAKAALQSAQINFQQSVTAVATARDTAAQNLITYQQAVDTAKKALSDAQANIALKQSGYSYTLSQAQQTLTQAKAVYDSYVGFYGPSGFTYTYCQSLININSNCTTLINDYNSWQSALAAYNNAMNTNTINVNSDSSTVSADQLSLANAISAQTNGIKKDQAAITSAQNSLELLKASDGVNVANPEAADFTVQQAALSIAQQNYDATFVKAPVTGDVASISAAVGANAPTASSSTIGSVSGFIVLTNVSSLEIKSGFSESDEAKLKVGQAATISFTALSNVNATGHIASIDLLPTTSSGATTYNVYIAIDGAVPGLKPGMTATPTIIVGDAPNVLQVSSQAVTVRGTRATVNVMTTKNGATVLTPTPVVIGLQGDSSDQIISGVKVGDKLAIRSATSTVASNGFPSVTGGGLGGLGGVGGGGAGRAGGGGFGG
jgi:multidrug efflux pump subunit AcrA (membrane-fusion protein)